MNLWVAAALVAAQGSDSGNDPWYRLWLRAETTSDWTALEFRNVSGCWVDRQDIKSETGVPVKQGPLRLAKAAGDTHPVSMTAVVYLRLPRTGDPELIVTRGNLGRTDVEITGIGRFAHDRLTGEGTNRRAFPLEAAALRALGPKFPFRGPRPAEKRALAFYYPWYGSPNGPSGRWVHWDAGQGHASRHTPVLGFYDSQDERVLSRHIEWAREAGLDGFVVSWRGPGSFEDRAFRRLVNVAASCDFRVTAYLERADRPLSIQEQVAYLLREYGEAPSWLRVRGRPVLFAYGRVMEAATAQDFERLPGEALLLPDTFLVPYGRAGGGMHTYNPVFQDFESLRAQYGGARAACSAYGLIFAATVVPGYDDTRVRRAGGRRSRERGRLYDAFWEVALEADPDWILICSWNEWHEGTEIEPSVENGERELRRTAEWIRRWKADAARER